jgi:flagellar assembly protein FliH
MTTQTPRPVKFNFDNVFGAKGAATQQAAPRARSSFSSDEVEAIRKETFQQGKADTEAAAAALKAQALSAVAGAMTTVIKQFDAAVLAMRQESALVALQVGRKMAEAALAHFPEKEVEAIVAECLHKLHREPRLVVRLSSACADALRADIDAMCQAQGYAGRVIIMAEPALAGADCSVEWADGGVERDMAETFAVIEQSAERWRASTSAEEN